MKPKTILTDADGCLLNWNKRFCEFMTEKGFPPISGTEGDYSIANRHGISHEDSFQYLDEFNHSDHMRDLESFADAEIYVPKIAALGFKFIVVTSISDQESAKDNRIENLKMRFGDVFEEIHCLKMGESKGYILDHNWGGSGLFWIEDHNKQAEAGHEAGLKTVLIDHPYNRHIQTDLFPRVSNGSPWKEIYEMVCKEYGLVEA